MIAYVKPACYVAHTELQNLNIGLASTTLQRSTAAANAAKLSGPADRTGSGGGAPPDRAGPGPPAGICFKLLYMYFVYIILCISFVIFVYICIYLNIF